MLPFDKERNKQPGKWQKAARRKPGGFSIF